MTKKHLIFIAFVILTLTLTVTLSGCGGEDDLLDGKYIVTFDLGGGTLDYMISSVDTEINYAYEPNTYVLDISKLDGYKLYKTGYNFTGWYTSPSCQPNEKWDFDGKVLDTETLTLYAGWERAIVYTYTLYYVDGENDVELGSYTVNPGDKFDDWRKFAQNREGHTPIGYFSDRALETPWDAATVHPGGDTDTAIPVYVDYIEGKWTLVNDLTSFRRAVTSGDAIYLTGDIDCGGEELNFSSTTYAGILEGNGFTVSNFTVNKAGTLRYPSCSIFDSLGDGAVIRNISFTNVTYKFFEINDVATTLKVASLAKEAGNVTVQNVTVSGKLTTDYAGDFPELNSAVFEEKGTLTSEGFTATVTVEREA